MRPTLIYLVGWMLASCVLSLAGRAPSPPGSTSLICPVLPRLNDLLQSSGTRRPHATTIQAIVAYPAFFNLKQVIVHGQSTQSEGGRLLIESDGGEHRLRVLSKSVGAPTGRIEARGEVWDIGRMDRADPRFAAHDIESLVAETGKNWPGAGELVVLSLASAVTVPPPMAPTVRSVALEPGRYADQRVTISGRFRGRNLYGDLPDAPAKSRWDFVLQSADAAIWITGMRPRGKEFNLDVNARADTGQWLEVSGVVVAGRGLVWLAASEVRLSKITSESPDEGPRASPTPAPAPIPPEVLFTAPAAGEVDVSPQTTVRIQFSRDMDAKSFRERVRVFYLGQSFKESGFPQTPEIRFTTAYNERARALEIRFTEPMARFKPVKIELLEGIVTTDQAPLKPWALEFSTGG